jgi:ribokinase
LGGEGAILLSEGAISEFTAQSVDVVDTTGAGDTFVGYFLAGLVDGLDAAQSMERAGKAAAIAITRLGAIPSIPMLNDVI